MKRFLFVCLMLVMSMITLLASTPVHEGYTISGHVIEKDSEEDIPFATILIVGTDKGAVSNEVGQFKLTNLNGGNTHFVFRLSVIGPWRKQSLWVVNIW